MATKKKVHSLQSGIAVIIDKDGKIHIAKTTTDFSVLCGKVIEQPGDFQKGKQDYCKKCTNIAFPKKK